jgi:hypothetical protein
MMKEVLDEKIQSVVRQLASIGGLDPAISDEVISLPDSTASSQTLSESECAFKVVCDDQEFLVVRQETSDGPSFKIYKEVNTACMMNGVSKRKLIMKCSLSTLDGFEFDFQTDDGVRWTSSSYDWVYADDDIGIEYSLKLIDKQLVDGLLLCRNELFDILEKYHFSPDEQLYWDKSKEKDQTKNSPWIWIRVVRIGRKNREVSIYRPMSPADSARFKEVLERIHFLAENLPSANDILVHGTRIR